MLNELQFASSSGGAAPLVHLPVPSKSARVFTAAGEHGPGGMTLHPRMCASLLWKSNSAVLPSRRWCSHSFPVGRPPVCSGLTLPPNVFCFLPWFGPPSLRQPPPVIRHRSPQSPGTTTRVHVTLAHSDLESLTTSV